MSLTTRMSHRWKSSSRKHSLLGTALVAALTLMALGSTAAADAASTMSITVGSEPVESITTQLGAEGTSSSADTFIYLKVKPGGGAGCAANVKADNGDEIMYAQTGNAFSYTQVVNYTFNVAGSYLVCGWMEEAGAVVAQSERAISVRQPHLSISVSAPPSVMVGETFQVATTAQAENARPLIEDAVPDTGRGCPANAAAAREASGAREVYGEWRVDGGPFTESTNEVFEDTGTYLFCAYFEYLAHGGREGAPEATASATTTVVSPPLPCVVPAITSGGSLASVEERLRAADCTVGRISSAASTTVARDAVLGLHPGSGAKLPPGAAVAIVESAGRPCVVPVVRAGSSLAHVEHQLEVADCMTTVSFTRSRHVRRGEVVSLGSPSHASLYPRSQVRILVSTGRH